MVEQARLSHRELAGRLLEKRSPEGTLLQRRATSHPALSPVGGNFGLSSIRVNMALTTDGPRIFVGGYKLLAYEALTDNLHHGDAGHLLARLDEATGRFDTAFRKRPGHQLIFSFCERHPATGAVIGGYAVPFAGEIFDLARQVAELFHEAPLLALDIAATDEGVKLLEVNQFWNPYMTQLLNGRGLLQELRSIVPKLAVAPAMRAEAEAILRGERTKH
jgi:hypothetical protein